METRGKAVQESKGYKPKELHSRKWRQHRMVRVWGSLGLCEIPQRSVGKIRPPAVIGELLLSLQGDRGRWRDYLLLIKCRKCIPE